MEQQTAIAQKKTTFMKGLIAVLTITAAGVLLAAVPEVAAGARPQVVPATPSSTMEALPTSSSASVGAEATSCTVPCVEATIQTALNNLACDIIKVQAGTCAVQLTVTRSLTLRGTGLGVTTLTAPAVMTSPKAIIRVSGASTIATIERFRIRGPGSVDDELFGVVVDGDATATIQNNRFLTIRTNPLGNSQNFFPICVGQESTSTVGHATVIGNRIEDYQGVGIIVDGTGSTATIRNNIIRGDDGPRLPPLAVPHGIQVSRGAVAELRNNRIFDNQYSPVNTASAGILIFGASNGVTVSHNTLDGNDIGIWVIGTDQATIEGNVARNGFFDGISLDNQNPPQLSAPVTTDDNTVRMNRTQNNGFGISLFSANGNTLEKNRAIRNVGDGVLVSCECDYTVNPNCGTPCSGSADFQASAHDNGLKSNVANQNDIGFFDDSVGGGTLGTDNIYTANKCAGNITAGSDPSGLCTPQP